MYKRKTNFHCCNLYPVYVYRPYFINFNMACTFYSTSDQVNNFRLVKYAGGVERAFHLTTCLSAGIFMKGEKSVLCLNCSRCLCVSHCRPKYFNCSCFSHSFFFRNWKKVELGSHCWNYTKSKYLNYIKDLMKKQRRMIKIILRVGRCKRNWMPFKEMRK